MTRRVIGPVAVAVDTNTKFRQGFSKIVAVARGDRVRMRPELEFIQEGAFMTSCQNIPNGPKQPFVVGKNCKHFLKNKILKGIRIHRVEIATGQYVVIRLHDFNGWNRTKCASYIDLPT